MAEDAGQTKERIAKRMARAGVASRREAEAMINAGRVVLNGEKLSTPATLKIVGNKSYTAAVWLWIPPTAIGIAF